MVQLYFGQVLKKIEVWESTVQEARTPRLRLLGKSNF